jgi:pimeloyl-ACP methyl ester carboxylesterase
VSSVAGFPAAQQLRLPELTLSVHDAGTGPAVVMCHGFPELGYSWRHQFPALVDAGFRAIAPDQRGYGASGAPREIAAYGLDRLTGDLVAMLDALEIERAVFVGHDWGGFVAWAMPVLHPTRVAGVIGVNTPYRPFPTTALLRAAFPDEDGMYILWFQKDGVAEKVLDASPRVVFERLMRHGAPLENVVRSATDFNPFRRLAGLPDVGTALLSDDELDVYARAFAKSGFRGGINWYRNIDRNGERFPAVGTAPLDLPCLMVTAEWDFALRPEMAAGMPALCRDLEMHGVAECGHWTQQEKPAELNRVMVDWLVRRFR